MEKAFPKVIFTHIDLGYKSIFVEHQKKNGYFIIIDNNLINEPFEKEKLEIKNYKSKKKAINYFKTIKELIHNDTIINSAIQSINNFRLR